jgi:hypothetical protein
MTQVAISSKLLKSEIFDWAQDVEDDIASRTPTPLTTTLQPELFKRAQHIEDQIAFQTSTLVSQRLNRFKRIIWTKVNTSKTSTLPSLHLPDSFAWEEDVEDNLSFQLRIVFMAQPCCISHWGDDYPGYCPRERFQKPPRSHSLTPTQYSSQPSLSDKG